MASTHETKTWSPRAKVLTAAVLTVWAGIAYLVGITGVFAIDETQVLRPIALTAAVPVALFMRAFGSIPAGVAITALTSSISLWRTSWTSS